MSCTVYVVAGEVSGDTHGAELMDALQEQLGEVEFRGLGGPIMGKIEGAEIIDWVDDAAVMGYIEVLKRYSWFKERLKKSVAEVIEWQPDVLLLVDYPGFNLRLAKRVREKCPDMKIVHYVAPQVWAWNQRRIPQIVASHDLMLCLFPFEVPVFEKAGLKAVCAGHPLIDELEEKRIEVERDPSLVGLFPGSRLREVTRLFPLMLEVAGDLHAKGYPVTFASAAASEKVEKVMRAELEKSGLPQGVVKIQLGGSQGLMQRVGSGTVASGTATLEAAYYGMPYCLVYGVAWATYLLARQVIKVPHIGLINILAGRELAPEFIQNDANVYEVSHWFEGILSDDEARRAHGESLRLAASRLGEPGVHLRAAGAIVDLLSS
ncbi:lipid-A-disaccharide synthase [Akkermansiaceae bacterium]|nr:lipid-A-disaccharide synthase [Akkermansiaceae bacterium]MDB4467238.1 lipid-A-disaccharide synthase [Akkermansiaceae bacterium]MDB4569589.1 lipid-A-disaccharide synthase [Akkermansiaceae bacterium]